MFNIRGLLCCSVWVCYTASSFELTLWCYYYYYSDSSHFDLNGVQLHDPSEIAEGFS
jgi:hypothetical protein